MMSSEIGLGTYHHIEIFNPNKPDTFFEKV